MVHRRPPCDIQRLDAETLAHIFKYVEFHARCGLTKCHAGHCGSQSPFSFSTVGVCRMRRRREVLPLVCKQWQAAAGAHSPIWNSCQLSLPERQPHDPAPAAATLRWSAVVR